MVMSQFLNLLGASSACVDFCDPTDFYRFKQGLHLLGPSLIVLLPSPLKLPQMMGVAACMGATEFKVVLPVVMVEYPTELRQDTDGVHGLCPSLALLLFEYLCLGLVTVV